MVIETVARVPVKVAEWASTIWRRPRTLVYLLPVYAWMAVLVWQVAGIVNGGLDRGLWVMLAVSGVLLGFVVAPCFKAASEEADRGLLHNHPRPCIL